MNSNPALRRFDDKTVIVTGGGSGIGRAAALRFGREGAAVVVADVADGNPVADEIKADGGRAVFVRADVAEPEDVKSLVEKAVKTFGGLDFAFNNAGIEGASAASADLPVEEWERVIRINLTGVFVCMKYELPRIVDRKGAIVNMSSILGRVGFANSAAYTASKHGVVGLTQAAALEYAGRGVRINCVCPGFIETPMLERAGLLADAKVRHDIVSLHPLNRLGRAEEVADAVAWLCSEESSFVTGAQILVDGGYTAR